MMEIKIEITGPMAVGKTMLMHEIGSHLKALGYDVSCHEGLGIARGIPPQKYDRPFDTERCRKTRVRINTVLPS